MRLFIIAICFLTASSCKPELENKADKVLYFDIKKIIAEQVSLLSSKKMHVQKFIRHDKQRENNIIEVNNWQQELKIFEEANLNRPIYKDAYIQKDSTAQGLKYTTFVAKSNDLQVRYFRAIYEDDKLKSLEANLKIENILYRSDKWLLLRFKPNKKIAGYGVKGKFAVVYGAKYDYEIDAVVNEL